MIQKNYTLELGGAVYFPSLIHVRNREQRSFNEYRLESDQTKFEYQCSFYSGAFSPLILTSSSSIFL